LSILSTAYGDSTFCKKEVEEFRQLRHPAFGLKVGTFSRFQAIVIERDYSMQSWPPELRTTSPCPFYNDAVSLFSKPSVFDNTSPWVINLWKVRDSIWATLDEMQKKRKGGMAVDSPYDLSLSEEREGVVYLAEVTDDLYGRRENLRTSLAQSGEVQVSGWSDPAAPPSTGLGALSVHLFGAHPGRPYPNQNLSHPRLQLEATLGANPARRPVVWVARDLDIGNAETEEHQKFLSSLSERNEVELLRTDFEDLKDEGQRECRRYPLPLQSLFRTRKIPSSIFGINLTTRRPWHR
jgi:hypothetical protein